MPVQLEPPSFNGEPDRAEKGTEADAGALNIVIVPKDDKTEECGPACCAASLCCLYACCPETMCSVMIDMCVEKTCVMCCGLCCSAFCCTAPWGTVTSAVLVLTGVIMWGSASSSAIDSTNDAINVVIANDNDGGGEGADDFVSAVKAFIWIVSILIGLLLLFVMFIAYTRFRMEYYKKAPEGRHVRMRNRQTQCAGVFSMSLLFMVVLISVFVLFGTTIWWVAATIATSATKGTSNLFDSGLEYYNDNVIFGPSEANLTGDSGLEDIDMKALRRDEAPLCEDGAIFAEFCNATLNGEPVRFTLQVDEGVQLVSLLPIIDGTNATSTIAVSALPPASVDALMIDAPWYRSLVDGNATEDDTARVDFVVTPAAAIAASLSPSEISKYNTTLREELCPSSICYDVSQLGFLDSDACICNDQLALLYDNSKDARNALGVSVAGAFILLTGLVLVLPAAASNLVSVRLRTELAGGGMQAVAGAPA